MLISKNKSMIFAVIDFNFSRSDSGTIPPRSFRGESSHELGFHGLRPAPVPSAPPHVSQIRRSIPGALSGSHLLLLGSVHRDGVRPVDRARRPAQHRIVSLLPPGETLSRGDAGKDLPIHLGRRERDERLPDLSGPRLCIDSGRPQVVPRRGTGDRAGALSLRPRLHDHRPVSLDVPVGHLSEDEGRHQDAHAPGPEGLHPYVYQRNPGRSARRQPSRRCAGGEGFRRHDGSRVHRLCAPLYDSSPAGVLRRTGEEQPAVPSSVVASLRTLSGSARGSSHLLVGHKSRTGYPESLRRIAYVDAEKKKRLVFLTNLFNVPPQMIADAYRKRWQVELFFKWIKQHLRIKAFYGTSANAVKTQIWIAVIVYLIVAIVKKRLHLPGSLHTILQIMEVNLFEKTDIIQVVEKAMRQETIPETGNQLNLFSS